MTEALPPVTIVLVDDHEIVRDGLARSFTAAGFEVVAQAGNGAEGVEAAARHRPDVVLMDLTMPVMDGVEATRRIVDANPAQKVVMLTMHDDVASTHRALVAGAVGYLTKGTAFVEVSATVRQAASGDVDLSSDLAAEIISTEARAANDALSERQIEILQLIADGMTTKQAARELGITVKTAHNHLNAIYRRLDTQSLTHAVLSAIRLGLINLRPSDQVDDD